MKVSLALDARLGQFKLSSSPAISKWPYIYYALPYLLN